MPTEPASAALRRGRAVATLAAAALLVLSLACASSAPRREVQRGDRERGLASWYGPGFHGRDTANGERYDMHALTAAHRTLPFGTVVEVRNRDNGRTVRVRINDRGPFVRGRIIDLSFAAADEIGMIGPGTAPVELRVVAAPAVDGRQQGYLVQAGAFRDIDRARDLERRLRRRYPEVRLRSDGLWHRVQVGPFDRRKRAEEIRRSLDRDGLDAVILETG